MGGTSSKLEKSLGGQLPAGENYYGLENFGNTCYCNSVLQALYFCQPFREKVLERAQTLGSNEGENLLDCLSNLRLSTVYFHSSCSNNCVEDLLSHSS